MPGDGFDRRRRPTGHFQAAGDTRYLTPPEGLGGEGAATHLVLAELQEAIARGESLLSVLAPRMAVMRRAVAILAPDASAEALCAGISAGERNFTMQAVEVLSARPDVCRRAQVILGQYELACRALNEAQELRASFLVAGLTEGMVGHFNLARFRGTMHPLYNVPMTLDGVPVLSRLFPPMPEAPRPPGRRAAGTQPLAAQEQRELLDVRELKELKERATGAITGWLAKGKELLKRPEP